MTTTFLPGRRYAVTGPNGAGKSTLLKILTGEIEPSKSSVTRPKKMGVLRHDQFAFDAHRVIDTVIMGKRTDRETLHWSAYNGNATRFHRTLTLLVLSL